MLYKLVWFVHYTQVAPLACWHCASCIVGDLCIFAGVQYAWCGLCIIVSCALQATGSTCSVASARRGGSGVTRREYAPPPDHLSYKEFSKERNAECLDFRFLIRKEFSTVPQGHSHSSLSLSFVNCIVFVNVVLSLSLSLRMVMMMPLLINTDEHQGSRLEICRDPMVV